MGDVYGQSLLNAFESSRVAEYAIGEIVEKSDRDKRPSMIWKPTLFQRKGIWFALYGEPNAVWHNPMYKMKAFHGKGASPEEAMLDFDQKWLEQSTAQIHKNCKNFDDRKEECKLDARKDITADGWACDEFNPVKIAIAEETE